MQLLTTKILLLFLTTLSLVQAWRESPIKGTPERSRDNNDYVINYRNCSIWNEHFNRPLYSAADRLNDKSGHRRVFLWTPGGKMWENSWALETYDGNRTFNIRNMARAKGSWKFTAEYLHASVSMYARDRREIRTCVSGNCPMRFLAGTWNIKGAVGSGKVTIQWAATGDYLFADGDHVNDKQRRHVFTYTNGEPRGRIWKESQWRIECL